MNTLSNLKMPRAVCCGEGALKKMPEILQAASVKKAAVFTDKGIRSAGLLDPVLEQLQKSQAAFCVLDDLPPEPSYGQVQKLVDACRAEGADMILAVGGTPNVIVPVPEQELKVGIVSDAMIADNVLLDPLMIKNLPRKIAAATGVDALAHAIECYTSNKANPISDTFALEALDMILNNILPACDSADAVSQTSAMQLASFYAGVAITASGTTAVHALSYPLGGKYHIAHGVSNAILLAPVMRFNAPACPERFAAAYDRCVHGEKTCVTQEEKTEFMLRWLEKIVRHLEIPTSLSAFGVPASDLETLVAAGMQVTRLLNNNLRPVTADDARALYRRIL